MLLCCCLQLEGNQAKRAPTSTRTCHQACTRVASKSIRTNDCWPCIRRRSEPIRIRLNFPRAARVTSNSTMSWLDRASARSTPVSDPRCLTIRDARCPTLRPPSVLVLVATIVANEKAKLVIHGLRRRRRRPSVVLQAATSLQSSTTMLAHESTTA